MSQNVDAWVQKAYIKGVTHKLQSQGFLLKGTTRDASKIEGKTAEFRVAARGVATPLAATWERAVPMNGDRSIVTLTLSDWQAADVIKHQDLNRMNVKEQDEVQKSAAFALGRKFDDLHFEEFDAQAGAIVTIGDGSTAMTLLDPINAKGAIKGYGLLDAPEIFCPLPENLWNKMMIYKQFSESTWAGGDMPLARGADKRTWNGVHYFAAPNELFTYDTGRSAIAWLSATWVQTYMWHRAAVGFASSYGLQSRITWENQYTGYFANNWMDAGVKTILPEAVKRLKFLFAPPSALPT
jgi:hypothetical protein